MKVCIITPIYHPYAHGGLESYSIELVHRLRDRGHNVTVITRGQRTAHLPDEGHGEIHQIRRAAFLPFLEVSRRPDRWMATHLEEMFSGYGASATGRLIREIRPDVLFSQAFYGFGRKMPRTIEALGIPWLHYVHSYGLVCKRQTAMTCSGRVCPRQCLDCKLICCFKHGGAPLREAITIYNSVHMRKFFEEAGVVTRESHVIHPVFSYDPLEVSATYDPAPPIRLVYVGRVSQEKGVHLLCDAVAAQPARYRLDVLGAGTQLAGLEARHGDVPIRFHGRVEPQRRDALLKEAHALVVPSLWNEPFGRVIQEGFLAGLPVIAADVGAMGSLVRHGVDGIVFNWRPGAELQSLIRALDEAVPNLARLRAGALHTRLRLLDQDNFAIIEGLLARAAAGRPSLAPRRAGAAPVEATGEAGL